MTIDDIKKAIREIEISYDYNHSKNDYDILLNLTELANLIKTLQGKAIDDFVHECDKYCGFYSGKNRNLTREDMLNIAERLKGKK